MSSPKWGMRKAPVLPYISGCMTRAASSRQSKRSVIMKTPDEHKRTRQGGLWTWLIVGLLYSAVMAALYGPFIWELISSA